VPPIPLNIFTDSNETPATPPTTAASICDELMLKQMEIKDEKKTESMCGTFFCGKNVPKLPDFKETISEIAIFGQFCFSHNIAGFLKFSTFLFDLEPNLANS
jgi:hypothetical protein